jgi:hypothetical protein
MAPGCEPLGLRCAHEGLNEFVDSMTRSLLTVLDTMHYSKPERWREVRAAIVEAYRTGERSILLKAPSAEREP